MQETRTESESITIPAEAAVQLVNLFYDKNNNFPENSVDYFCWKKSINDVFQYLEEIKKEVKKL